MLFYALYLLISVGALNAFQPLTSSHHPRSSVRQFASSPTKNDVGGGGPVPITLLSGFLGTGKTCALKNLLENKEDLKIGVIVNDVASVNIDAKLVANQAGDMIELQNGCACCSLSDELIFGVEKLMVGRELDAIVVELSGIADPAAVKSSWEQLIDEVPATIKNVVTLVDATTFGTDYMTWDLAADRKGWVTLGDDCSGNRKISELLAEQVEAANVVVVNKIDVATPDQVIVATKVAKALNEKAEVVQAEFGKMPANLMIDTSRRQQNASKQKPDQSHEHNHKHSDACDDPGCTDESHSHSHNHAEASCSDPDCTDESHAHSHSHSHQTTTEDLGITSFVYTATKPFQIDRLMNLLHQWPVPIKEVLDVAMLNDEESTSYDGPTENPFTGVIRSKGFCWFAPRKWSGSHSDAWRHDTVMYWSNAGRQMGISKAGKWWAMLPDDKMKAYLADKPEEYIKIKTQDFKTEEFGDRRQELVFIGTDLRIEEITVALNSCLSTAREMDAYRQKLENHKQSLYSTPMQAGLFDTATTDHMG